MSDAALAWLRAQLDDDERVARDFVGACWHVEYCDDLGPAFHARWDPARVLAEIEAKRRILDDYDIVVSAIRRVDDVEGNQLLYARRDARMSDIRWLAQPYADRPGFPQEWQT